MARTFPFNIKITDQRSSQKELDDRRFLQHSAGMSNLKIIKEEYHQAIKDLIFSFISAISEDHSPDTYLIFRKNQRLLSISRN